ncbi:DUF302 domain-containing protein [Thiohalophilus sp.]|uniref:DUF302 domain-containing protein n=1 Tax=Thiohalophilus sp. TaxID=3028392 RepID=UPI002ACED867|nr:DUF302 domain-containing protein [Thiohalophilus sp.]MDZ7803315.1 DUF302 domain-containing protein [Thiohalophilus sp.]
MKRLTVFILGLCLLPAAWAGDVPGLVVKQSPHSAAETLDRLENVLKKKGIGIVTRWNHAEKAAGVDIPLRDTELLLFGNPALGSHMFTSQQTAGIDLPMKALAWKDENGQVWLGYNDPQYIADRHGISNRSEIIARMQGALDKLSDAAIAR